MQIIDIKSMLSVDEKDDKMRFADINWPTHMGFNVYEELADINGSKMLYFLAVNEVVE